MPGQLSVLFCFVVCFVALLFCFVSFALFRCFVSSLCSFALFHLFCFVSLFRLDFVCFSNIQNLHTVMLLGGVSFILNCLLGWDGTVSRHMPISNGCVVVQIVDLQIMTAFLNM